MKNAVKNRYGKIISASIIVLVLVILCVEFGSQEGITSRLSIFVVGLLIIICAIVQQFVFFSTDVLRENSENIDAAKKGSGNNTQSQKTVILEKIDAKGLLPTSYSGLEDFSSKLLSNIATEFKLVQALMYVKRGESFEPSGAYAFFSTTRPAVFKIGEGIPGQVARSKRVLCVKNVPDDYITVVSGLGGGSPRHLVVLPVTYKNECVCVLELSSFIDVNVDFNDFSEKLSSVLGEVLAKFLD